MKSLKQADAEVLKECVQRAGPFATPEQLWRGSRLPAASLRHLAKADAFRSMGLDRQHALWQIAALKDTPMPLFEESSFDDEAGLDRLPEIAPLQRTLNDYEVTGLSLRSHPVAFIRDELERRGVSACGALRDGKQFPAKRAARVAGVVLARQRPATASGVVFVTLEDETGIANLIIWSDVFERCRRVARLSTVLEAEGTVEREGDVVHVHVKRLRALDDALDGLRQGSRDFH